MMTKISQKKKEKGITLMVLAITIIILLILAAVVVKLALEDGGVLGEARQATSEWDKASEDEKSELKKLAEEMRKSRNGTIGGGSTGGNQGGTGEGTGGNETGGNIAKPGQAFKEETKITVDGKDVTVPGGATISGVEGETTIEEGLVMYVIPEGVTVDWSNEAEVEYAQKTYTQFVWVPVETAILDLSNREEALATNETIKAAVELEISKEKYPMAIKKADGNYMGVLYNFTYDGTLDKVVLSCYSGWTPLGGRGEPYADPAIGHTGTTPYYGDGYANLLAINGILNRKYTKTDEFLADLQTEFNSMVESVYSKGGFWIGRYETSGMSNETTTSYVASNEIKVSSVKGATSGLNIQSWHRVYAEQCIYTKKANITGNSSMIWGSQWDQMMIWLKDIKNTTQGDYTYYILDATGMGNGTYTGTGKNSVRNIYELAGGLTDVTLEWGGAKKSGSTTYTQRISRSIALRNLATSNSLPNTVGSRMILY